MLNLVFPNAFTPNGDTRNAVFRPVQNGQTFSLESYELSIYNRWGQRIWQGSDAMQGWDRERASVGVYFWLCRYTLPGGGRRLQKGDVSVLR